MYCKLILRRVCIPIVAVKRIIITCSEGVSLDLIIQHAKRMRRIVLSALASLAVPRIST